MSNPQQVAYKFGRFCLRPGDRQLLCDDNPVPLAPKMFDTLLLLVESQGRLLEKDEFLKRVWPDSFVEEVALAHAISHVRKALREGTGESSFIETVPKRGYRFLARVEILGAAGHEAALPVRLAVLPFENLGADPELEYMADGLTDEVIAAHGEVARRDRPRAGRQVFGRELPPRRERPPAHHFQADPRARPGSDLVGVLRQRTGKRIGFSARAQWRYCRAGAAPAVPRSRGGARGPPDAPCGGLRPLPPGPLLLESTLGSSHPACGRVLYSRNRVGPRLRISLVGSGHCLGIRSDQR